MALSEEPMRNRFDYLSRRVAKEALAPRAAPRHGQRPCSPCFRIRGIAVPDGARQRIQSQKDPEQLERWLEKAIVATSIGDVIDDPS